MAGYLFPALAAILGGLFLASKNAGGGNALPQEDKGKYLSRMRDTRVAGPPISHSPAGTFIYQWAWGGRAGETTAQEFIDASIAKGWDVWADLTLASQDRFYLALARPGQQPAGQWFILASASDAKGLAPGGYRPPSGGINIPVPIPADAVPIPTAADAAKIPGVPGAPVPAPPVPAPPVPAPPVPAPPVAATTTGLPDVDERLAASDATPYQLRAIAAELRKSGKGDAAAVVERRASDLYATLRARHAAMGGTPFKVVDHHGGGVSGHLPANVASHYGGTLAQLGKNNPGKKQWGGWTIGSTWLLPLDWDAEAKAPPPIAGVKKAAATAAPKPASTLKSTKPGKVRRA
jgi:hypothetical protein